MKKRLKTAAKKVKKSLRAPRKTRRVSKKIQPKYVSKPLKKKKIESTGPFVSRPADSFELPAGYGDTQMVLLARDPWWIFAFWEVQPGREKQILDELERQRLEKEKTVLRVYNVTESSPSAPGGYFDIELNFFANNWYINAGKPDTKWVAELGIRAKDGRFFSIARSNTVRTPRYGISDQTDEEWMMPDDLYWKLFGRMANLSDIANSQSLLAPR